MRYFSLALPAGALASNLTRSTRGWASLIIRFRSGDITIAATLFAPPGSGPLPAIVIAHGSEAASRKDPHYRPSAIRWTQAGYAVLLSDKRGVGDSGGEYVEAPDLRIPPGDILAAVEYLRTRTDFQAANIGVLGGSQEGRDQVAALLEPVRHEPRFQRAQFRDVLPEPADLGESRFDFPDARGIRSSR